MEDEVNINIKSHLWCVKVYNKCSQEVKCCVTAIEDYSSVSNSYVVIYDAYNEYHNMITKINAKKKK